MPHNAADAETWRLPYNLAKMPNDLSCWCSNARRFGNGIGNVNGNMIMQASQQQQILPGGLPGVELPGQPMTTIGSNMLQVRNNTGMSNSGANWGGSGAGGW